MQVKVKVLINKKEETYINLALTSDYTVVSAEMDGKECETCTHVIDEAIRTVLSQIDKKVVTFKRIS